MASHFVTCLVSYYWNHKHTASLIIQWGFFIGANMIDYIFYVGMVICGLTFIAIVATFGHAFYLLN
jgi:hypothetical protein